MVQSRQNKILTSFLLLSLLAGTGHAQQQDLYINEFQAANVSSVPTPFSGEFSDWIEIYNAGDQVVELFGFYLTDDRDVPNKWQILVGRQVLPGEYIVFWADGFDNFLRTNFKLKKSGGFIGFYTPDGLVIDSLSYGFQEDNISYGRILFDLNSWAYFDMVTPGSPNPGNYMTGKTPDLMFSLKGGFYSGSQTVSITAESPDIGIHYTVDGRSPGMGDSIYRAPLVIDSTTSLRVRGFKSGLLPGNILTQTYFINEPVNLPFISLTTDPANLFDDSIGIYVIGTNGVPGYCSSIPHNTNRDWERPVNIELYDSSGIVELNQMAGLKIFGGCSRTRYPQKSLALYARNDYGNPVFSCQIFKDKPIYNFQSFILRSSADDVVHTMYKDAMGQALLTDMDIDKQAYRPAVVFINGRYWGIHNIREKISEHYVSENYGLDIDNINLLERYPAYDYNVIHGSAYEYNRMITYISNRDMEEEGVYEYFASLIDMNNYIDYQIAQIYLSANDWPGNNIKFWNSTVPPYDKWRWIVFDLDNCFFYDTRNTLELATNPNCKCNWPNPPWSTLLFRKLLENETFRNEFIQRYAWHMNTTFLPSRIIHFIDSMKENIAPEIPRHIERWGGQMVPYPESWIRPTFNSIDEWEENIERMRRFARRRPEPSRQHVMEYFGLPWSMMHLTIHSDDPQAGIIKINKQVVPGMQHSGDYFKDVPMIIKAIPALGYRFAYWDYNPIGQPATRNKSSVLEITPSEDLVLTAHFTKVNGKDQTLVINEINYHSPDDPDPSDWLELYNQKNEFVDLTGWYLQDEDDSHLFKFPKGLEIGPYGYLVLCEDQHAFDEVFVKIKNRFGNLGFGLSNAGEVIRLYAPDSSLIDSVRYDDDGPWPESPDGSGPTLELISPQMDNDLPKSWAVSYQNGTPGMQNFSNAIERNILQQNFPNPTDDVTIIPYSIKTPGYVVIRVYDIFGQEIETLVSEQKEISNYQLSWNTGHLSGGIYVYTLTVDNNFADAKKMIITR